MLTRHAKTRYYVFTSPRSREDADLYDVTVICQASFSFSHTHSKLWQTIVYIYVHHPIKSLYRVSCQLRLYSATGIVATKYLFICGCKALSNFYKAVHTQLLLLGKIRMNASVLTFTVKMYQALGIILLWQVLFPWQGHIAGPRLRDDAEKE